MKIQYVVLRGKNAGLLLSPHRYEDGYFQAYKSNSRADSGGVSVRTEAELIDLVRRGYHVRMSNLGSTHPPSIVRPEIVA